MNQTTKNTTKELDKALKKVANVYLILKDGQKAGFIFTRWSKSLNWDIAHVTLIFNSVYPAICCTQSLGGCGYNKFYFGMERILTELRDQLKSLNIDVDSVKDLANHWQDVFTKSGYQVVYVF